MCKYFRSKTSCPFEELGCKFSHDIHKSDEVNQKVVDITSDVKNSISVECSLSFEKEDETSLSFHASTPKSFYNCEDCQNKSQCVDCFVKHILGGHGNGRKLLF